MTRGNADSSTSGPTPETILAHELVGLRARVVEATNGDLVGLSGRVVEETTNTLRIEGDDEDAGRDTEAGVRVRTVPKAGATFEFALPSGEFVVVDGGRLVARPARRTKHATGGKTWHSA